MVGLGLSALSIPTYYYAEQRKGRYFKSVILGAMQITSVLVVAKGLDHKGILANTGFVLGLTSGRLLPENTFGPDVTDGDGSKHRFLTNIGHYVREAGQSKLQTLRKEFADHPDVTVVDYTDDAAPADYKTYEENLAKHKGEEIVYRAIHIFGPEEIVVPKTKNLSMFK